MDRLFTLAAFTVMLFIVLVGVYIHNGMQTCSYGVVKQETKWVKIFGKPVEKEVNYRGCTNPNYENENTTLFDTFHK